MNDYLHRAYKCICTYAIEYYICVRFVTAFKQNSSTEVTRLSLWLAHYQDCHVTAAHTSQSFSEYGNLPLLKLEGPLLRHSGM